MWSFLTEFIFSAVVEFPPLYHKVMPIKLDHGMFYSNLLSSGVVQSVPRKQNISKVVTT